MTTDKTKNLTPRQIKWLETRKQGFYSFIIPITIILIQLTRTNDTVYSALAHLINTASLNSTFEYFYTWFIIEIGLNLFKYVLCCEVFGMSHKHYWLIIGRRDKWSDSEIIMLEKIYSMRQLKIMDAIYRRAGHIVVNFWRIYYYVFLVNTQVLRLQVAILQLPIIFSIKKLTEFNKLGNFVYQGCRIRDGQYGRFNQVVVNFWAYCSRIIMMILLLEYNFPEATNQILIALAMQPLIWGDTFGEIIGSFCGKHEFSVRGIGEINKKTIEGTVSVFISSFISLVVTYFVVLDLIWGGDPNLVALQFKFSPYVVFMYTAFVCMIVEVCAFRGTDNFFLQTVGLSLLLFSLN